MHHAPLPGPALNTAHSRTCPLGRGGWGGGVVTVGSCYLLTGGDSVTSQVRRESGTFPSMRDLLPGRGSTNAEDLRRKLLDFNISWVQTLRKKTPTKGSWWLAGLQF